MADITMTLLSERWLDEVVLTTTKANVGADTNDRLIPPAGLGDLAIMELLVTASSIATMLTDAVLGQTGAVAFVSSAAGNLDFVGVGKWYRTLVDRLSLVISPDPLVQMKEGELVVLQYPELDTNAAPTDDHVIFVKCVRVRPQAGAPGPIRLVR